MLAAACSPLTAHLVLGPPRTGRVLAALEQVVYVGFGHEVLPVETSGAVGLPTALRVPAANDGWGAAAGDPVTAGGGRLALPAAVAGVARHWRPARVRRAVVPRPGLGRLEAEVDAACAAIGLGPGLTPAADDELCGMLLVAVAHGLRPDVRAPVGRTTDLSASLVRAAADGYAVAPLVRVVEAAVRGGAVAAADLAAVRALGHSSGPALLAGVARGLAALGPEEGRRVA